MDVVPLKNTAGKIRPVGRAGAQPLQRCLLVPERLQEGVRELLRGKGLLDQRGNGFFDLNSIHSEDSAEGPDDFPAPEHNSREDNDSHACDPIWENRFKADPNISCLTPYRHLTFDQTPALAGACEPHQSGSHHTFF
ncbi:MAG: hypothetical protein LBG44_04665 [Gemmatimonadota bacterium]|nr:hypothetical protein [Gemmatimonadota bacterium]